MKFRLKGRSLTKPGTLLKHSIPMRTFADWNEKEPGFVEADLVGHEGGNLRGEFFYSLNGFVGKEQRIERIKLMCIQDGQKQEQ